MRLPLVQRLRSNGNASHNAGARGELLAAKHLKRGGYRILARNVRNRFGEIDLVAQAPDGRTVVIVEVKTTDAPSARGTGLRPEVHVTADKQRRLIALAVQYVRRHRLDDRRIRFDVIGIDLPPGEPASAGGRKRVRLRERFRKPKPVIRHHVGAFQSRV